MFPCVTCGSHHLTRECVRNKSIMSNTLWHNIDMRCLHRNTSRQHTQSVECGIICHRYIVNTWNRSPEMGESSCSPPPPALCLPHTTALWQIFWAVSFVGFLVFFCVSLNEMIPNRFRFPRLFEPAIKHRQTHMRIRLLFKKWAQVSAVHRYRPQLQVHNRDRMKSIEFGRNEAETVLKAPNLKGLASQNLQQQHFVNLGAKEGCCCSLRLEWVSWNEAFSLREQSIKSGKEEMQ